MLVLNTNNPEYTGDKDLRILIRGMANRDKKWLQVAAVQLPKPKPIFHSRHVKFKAQHHERSLVLLTGEVNSEFKACYIQLAMPALHTR